MSDVYGRIAALERRLAALERRQAQPLGFGRSTAAPIDTGPVQTIQGQMDALSRRDAMPVLYHYGMTASMPIGGDKVIAYLGSDRSQGVVIATGHQSYRLANLENGEVALYDMWGRWIKLSATGIVINGNGVPVLIENADLHVTGAVIAGWGGSDQVGLQTHRHTQPSDGHGDTEQPTNAPTAGT